MAENTIFQREIEMLSLEVAAARRQLAQGKQIDLTQMPTRMKEIFDSVDRLDAKSDEPALITLMAECDDLVRELQSQQDRLSAELKSSRDRQKAASAYRSPVRG